MSSQTHLISFKNPRKNPWISVFPKYLGVTKRRSDAFAVFCRQPNVIEVGFTCQDLLPFRYEALRAMMQGRKCRRFRRLVFFKSTDSLRDGVGKWEKCFCVGCMFMHVLCWICDITGRVDILWTLSLKFFFLVLKPDVGLSWGKATFIHLSYFLSEPSHCISSNIHPGKLTAGI